MTSELEELHALVMGLPKGTSSRIELIPICDAIKYIRKHRDKIIESVNSAGRLDLYVNTMVHRPYCHPVPYNEEDFV